MMGVHGNGLTALLWMRPTPRSTVIEFFYPGGFAHDYEYTTRALGMVHYGFWNDRCVSTAKASYLHREHELMCAYLGTSRAPTFRPQPIPKGSKEMTSLSTVRPSRGSYANVSLLPRRWMTRENMHTDLVIVTYSHSHRIHSPNSRLHRPHPIHRLVDP